MTAHSYREALAPGHGATGSAGGADVVVLLDAADGRPFGLGEAVAARRAELRLSQMELARAAGVQQADISRIERGKGNPTLGTLTKLFAALGLTLSVSPARVPASR